MARVVSVALAAAAGLLACSGGAVLVRRRWSRGSVALETSLNAYSTAVSCMIASVGNRII